MKKLFVAAMVTLSLSITSASFAKAYPAIKNEPNNTAHSASVTLTQTEKSKLDVTVENTASAIITIGLYDSSGAFLASKTITTNEMGNRLRFNLASLKDGVYQVKIKEGKATQVKKFELKTVTPVTVYQNLTFL